MYGRKTMHSFSVLALLHQSTKSSTLLAALALFCYFTREGSQHYFQCDVGRQRRDWRMILSDSIFIHMFLFYIVWSHYAAKDLYPQRAWPGQLFYANTFYQARKLPRLVARKCVEQMCNIQEQSKKYFLSHKRSRTFKFYKAQQRQLVRQETISELFRLFFLDKHDNNILLFCFQQTDTIGGRIVLRDGAVMDCAISGMMQVANQLHETAMSHR